MGNHPNVTADKMPKQGQDLHQHCTVVFGYDFGRRFRGIILRNDLESPYQTLIMLEDGGVIRAEECQYSVS